VPWLLARGAGALIFSQAIPDLLFGIRRCLWRLGGLPQTLVWNRKVGLHAGGGTNWSRQVLRRARQPAHAHDAEGSAD
jgi:hypothetical protein